MKNIPGVIRCALSVINITAAALLCLAAPAARSAPLEYRLSFDGTLDNREYGVAPLNDETFFFARGVAEAGVAVDGKNRIRAGGMPTVWFGAPETARVPVNALMYFQHESRRVRFRFGSFPRQTTGEHSSPLQNNAAATTRAFPRQTTGERLSTPLNGHSSPLQNNAAATTSAFPHTEALGLPHQYYRAESSSQTAFPRAGALESVPAWFFGDESAYRRPYVHGAAVDAGDFWGLAAGAYVDWTGLRDTNVNEAFLFGYGLSYRHGAFFAGHDFMMYHFARPLNPAPGEAVKDNGGFSAEIGAARGKIIKYIDTAAVSAGAIASLDRDRADMVWHTPAGGFVSGFAGYGMLALRGFCYAGQAQRLAWGESVYRYSGIESFVRGDVILRFFNKNQRTPGTNLRAELISSFYLIDGKFGTSQHFVLHAAIWDPLKSPRQSTITNN